MTNVARFETEISVVDNFRDSLFGDEVLRIRAWSRLVCVVGRGEKNDRDSLTLEVKLFARRAGKADDSSKEEFLGVRSGSENAGADVRQRENGREKSVRVGTAGEKGREDFVSGRRHRLQSGVLYR